MELQYQARLSRRGKSRCTKEIEKIADMLVLLHTITHPFYLRGRHEHPVKGSRWYFYTCRHFDGANCTDYENRPRMCSEYPHYGKGNACQYPGCTWAAGKYPQAKDVRGTRVDADVCDETDAA